MPPSEPHADGESIRPFIVALTGGIGSGKSTVAKIFEELGAHRLDADLEARGVLGESEIVDQLVDHFGDKILSAPGVIDRKSHSDRVFSDQEALRYLESVVHPAVRARIDVGLEKLCGMGFDGGSPFPEGRVWILLDIPLLETSPYRNKVDRILFVDAPEEDRESRVVGQRGWAAGERARRERSQVPLAEKRAGASNVIENSNATTTGELKSRCQHLIQLWIAELN